MVPNTAKYVDVAKNSILGERKFRLMNQRDMAKLVREVAMSIYLVQVVVLSVARQAGTVARKTRRTRTSDSVVGFMQQRPSKLRDMCRQRGKGIADDMLFIEHSH